MKAKQQQAMVPLLRFSPFPSQACPEHHTLCIVIPFDSSESVPLKMAICSKGLGLAIPSLALDHHKPQSDCCDLFLGHI